MGWTEIIIGLAAPLITGAVTLVGVIANNGKNRALTDHKIAELTREVREHNGFARRLPVLEEKLDVANHRISDLEDWQREELRKV